MISSDDLVLRAREVVNPRELSPTASVGDVGCALVTDKGTVYIGVSIDTACSMGFCAEHNAIGAMITHGESRIVKLAAVDWNGNVVPPCGRCREFIFQIDPQNADTIIILSGGREKALRDLLPEHWSLSEA